MSIWNVTIKAVIEVDDPDTLQDLIIVRLYNDKPGNVCVDSGSDVFALLDYPDDWLDFEEIIE
tara:strand:- start:169 stop:357 length:189 start_codon:yes stop_codon:yes gene_type:complete